MDDVTKTMDFYWVVTHDGTYYEEENEADALRLQQFLEYYVGWGAVVERAKTPRN